MTKFLRIIARVLIVIVIVLIIVVQAALFYSEKIDLKTGRSISQCTGVLDSTYLPSIIQSRLVIKSMMETCELPALSVAISSKGKLIWSEALGYSDLESAKQACPDNIFRIGSISKTLTAAALMRVAEKHKIGLYDDIRMILPEYPDKGFPITPIQLATHAAGIRPYRDDSEAITTLQFNSAIESVQRFRDDPLIFPPGTGFEYSNYGYVLLSAVMEKACGKNFPDIMNEEIFNPLGMRSTSPEINDSTNAWLCTFYDNVTPYSLDGRINKSPYINHSSKWASGGFLSTAEDLIKFSDAIDNQFLNPKSVSLMFQAHTSQVILHYGMGWMIARDPYLRKAYFHFGAGSGATSLIVKYPAYDFDMAILSNLGHAKFPYSHLIVIINQFLPRPVNWIFYSFDILMLIGIAWAVRKKFRTKQSKGNYLG